MIIKYGLTLIYSWTAMLASGLLLRNLWRFLAFDAQFSAIFAQIADAPMRLPMLRSLLCGALLCALIALLARRGHRVCAVGLGAVGWVLLFALCLVLTEVNGVRFGDVLVTLVPLLLGGGL